MTASQLVYYRQKDAWAMWNVECMSWPFNFVRFDPTITTLQWAHRLGTTIVAFVESAENDIDPADIAQTVEFPMEWRVPYINFGQGRTANMTGIFTTIWGKELGTTAQIDYLGGFADLADYNNLDTDSIAFYDVNWARGYFPSISSFSTAKFPSAVGSVVKTYFRDLWGGVGVTGKVISPVISLIETSSTLIRRLEIFSLKVIFEDGGVF